MRILALLLLPFSLLFGNVDAIIHVIAGEVKQAGFLISSDGDLLTLYHPIKEETQITIEHKNHFYLATLRSHDNDIAHLEIPGHDFPFLEIGEAPVQGEWGLIGGYLFRRAYIRSTMVSGHAMDFLLLDTPFNPTEIGGPLLDLEGKVIGLNCSNKKNLGLAIPIN
jgi:S1-C subfamily serine protease